MAVGLGKILLSFGMIRTTKTKADDGLMLYALINHNTITILQATNRCWAVASQRREKARKRNADKHNFQKGFRFSFHESLAHMCG
jgi:hypothetical protein